MDTMKSFECSEDNFMVRGHDKDEIIIVAKMHAEKEGKNLSDEELEDKIEEV